MPDSNDLGDPEWTRWLREEETYKVADAEWKASYDAALAANEAERTEARRLEGHQGDIREMDARQSRFDELDGRRAELEARGNLGFPTEEEHQAWRDEVPRVALELGALKDQVAYDAMVRPFLGRSDDDIRGELLQTRLREGFRATPRDP